VEAIFFDFDGVILDSMPIRDLGFREIFRMYDDQVVEQLISYHKVNGGLSRFHKIKYFFNELLNTSISEKKITQFANQFSEVMRENLVNPSFIIQDTLDFIRSYKGRVDMHIVSGSEEEELRWLCNKLKIEDFFISINGSPTPKTELVGAVLEEYHYNPMKCVLIGDSINDLDAAVDNSVVFYGFNNSSLRKKSTNYINSYVIDFPH